MQANMIDSLNISCSNQENENDLIADRLDCGAGCKESTPITMMVLPCTTDSDNSSKETSKTHLTVFSGKAIPHFYQWRKDVLHSLKLLKISPSLQGKYIQSCLRGSAKDKVEAEMKFTSLPSAEEVLGVLKKWFGFHHLIVRQLIKAHRDCGRIPSPGRMGRRVSQDERACQNHL